MPDVDPTHYRLNDLKLRWEQDPSSRLFLQLADEYRKLDQHQEAVAVLEQGLEHRPNDLSALVALGRCRLELERVEDAIEPLEAVVARDPTHIVASKLLIEAQLRRGDAEQAAKRLETYRLLNDRDPELDHLEYRLERLREEAGQEAPAAGVESEAGEIPESPEDAGAALAASEAEAGGDGVPEDVAVAEAELASPEPEDVAGVASTELEDVAETELASPELEDVAGDSESASPESAAAAADPDPFPLSAELPSAPDLGALWERLPEPSVRAEPFRGLTSIGAARHWELLSREGIFTTPGAAAAGISKDEASSVAEPVVEATVEAPAPAEAVGEPVEESADAVASQPAVAESAEESPPVSEPAPAGDEPAEEPATVTLGELYLKQGYREEARRIFRRVLEQDPGSRAALEHLERLDRRRHRPLSAADLLAVRSASGRIPEGLTAKKVLVLGNYANHLRAAAEQRRAGSAT